MKMKQNICVHILTHVIVSVFMLILSHQALPLHAQTPVVALSEQADKVPVMTTVANLMLDTLKPATVRYGGFAGIGTYSLGDIQSILSEIPQLLTLPMALPILPYRQRGVSLGFRLGGLWETPLGIGNDWRFQGRLELSRFSANMASKEQLYSRVGSNTVRTIGITHNLEAEVWSASLSALVVYRPLRFLSLMAGFDLHSALFTTITTFELLDAASTDFVRFERGDTDTTRDTRTRRPSVGIQPGFSIGASYEIPLNFEGTMLLAPEVFYSFLSSPLRESTAQGLRASLALRFAPGRTTPLTPEEIQERIEREQRRQEAILAAERKRQEEELAAEMKRQAEALEAERARTKLALETAKMRQDSIVQTQKRVQDSVYALQQAELQTMKKGIITAKITSVNGVENNGNVIPNPKLLVEEFLSTTTRFVWNRLVFEENSASISSRYRRIASANRGTFKPTNGMGEENGEALYAQILNITGWYLTENPSEKLTVLASAASSENEPDKLADIRAQAIVDYLELIWKIPRKRMKIERENAPAPFERSVALRVEKQERLQWVSVENKRRTVTPEAVDIGLEVFAGSGLKQWNMEIIQFDNREVVPLHSTTGTTNLPSAYRWNIGTNQESMPRSGGELTVEFEAFDSENHQSDKQLQLIPVEYRSVESKQQIDSSTGKIKDKRLDRYSFIVTVANNGEVIIDPLIQAKMAELRTLVAEEGTLVLTGYDVRNEGIAQLIAKGVARLLDGVKNLRVQSQTKLRRTATGAVSAEDSLFGRFATIEVLLPTLR
ncbi:MAG: hypothetical protein EAZ92_02865 [Candidatus Kapaibacterium sp.]|nr:MAG: hypothetical protein EAZ92_02865 [Candidatus Kapabacteria bacterium]